jgi:PAS domain S-box-containing protein
MKKLMSRTKLLYAAFLILVVGITIVLTVIISNGKNTSSRPTMTAANDSQTSQPLLQTSTPGGTLIVGGDDSYPPFSYLENGIAQGFDNDLMREYARVMGMNVEFKLTPWAEAKQNLIDGKVDVIGGMVISDQRKELYSFGTPHTILYFDLFVRKNSKINTLEDIQGTQIIVQNGGIMADYLKSMQFSGEIVSAENPLDALKLLASGEYDGALLNSIQGYYYIRQNRLSNLRSIGLRLSPGDYAFAVKKGNQNLLLELNQVAAIVEMNGVYTQFSNKWLTLYEKQSLLEQFRYYIYGAAVLITLFILISLWVWSLRREVKKRTAQLKESEEKYKILINNATGGVIVIRDEKPVYINPHGLMILGLPYETLNETIDLKKFVHPKDLNSFLDQLQTRLNGIVDQGFIDLRMYNTNHEVRWVRWNSVLIDWEGNPAILGFFSDISEEKAMGDALSASEERYRLLFTKSPFGLIYYDKDLKVTNINDRLLEILNSKRNRIEGIDLNNLNDKRILPAFRAVLEHEEGYYEGLYLPTASDNPLELYISLHTTPVFNETREFVGGIGLVEDTTELFVSEHKIKSLEDRYTKAFLTSPDAININRLKDGMYIDINRGFTELTGYTSDETIGKTSLELNIWADPKDRQKLVKGLQQKGEVKNLEALFRYKNGEVRTGLMSATVIEVNGEQCILSITRDITELRKNESAIRESEIRYRSIYNTVPVSIWEQDFLQVYDMLEEIRSEGITDLMKYLNEHPEFIDKAVKEVKILSVNDITLSIFKAKSEEELFTSINKFFRSESFENFKYELLAIWEKRTMFEGETVNQTLEGNRIDVNVIMRLPEKREDFRRVLVSISDITQRKAAEIALKESEDRYRKIFNSIPVSIIEEDYSQVKIFLNDLKKDGVTDMDLYLDEHPDVVEKAAEKLIINEVNSEYLRFYNLEKKPDVVQSIDGTFTDASFISFKNELLVLWNNQPIYQGETEKLTKNGDKQHIWITVNFPERDEDLSRVLVTIMNITELKVAEEQIRNQVQHLAALRAVDMAISASMDLPTTLRILLNQITQQLDIAAASILMLNQNTQTLDYAAGIGFKSAVIEQTSLRLGQSLAGRVALERRIASVDNLQDQGEKFKNSGLWKEGFTHYLGIPLIAKGVVKGVLELFNRKPFSQDPEWMGLLESMAGQGGIAIENSTLLEEVQNVNTNLRVAYDATIEGWAHAMEMRDGDQAGHSKRVADLTIDLAQAMGFRGDDLLTFRRGALLHDVGKIGVPDGILLKPGPLTEDEWAIMHQHPEIGKNLISSIEFLHTSLDIPYCHHEQWDGKGYPRGLKGEEIPIGVRIFTLVDWWDALRSDRPFRKAWTDKKTWKYLKENAGIVFDPKIVEKFGQFLGLETKN